MELCSAMDQGGVTPSAGLIHAVRKAVPFDVFVLIRPREGDFCYSAAECGVMREDVLRARDLGADGVVLGILREDGRVDVEATARLVAAARPMQVTFHRAFDVAEDLDRALEDVIAAGADRILTSGGERLGLAGAERIAGLVGTAAGRVTMLGAGGIRAANAREFVERARVRELHTSLRGARVAVRRGGKLAADFGPAPYVLRVEDVKELRAEVG